VEFSGVLVEFSGLVERFSGEEREDGREGGVGVVVGVLVSWIGEGLPGNGEGIGCVWALDIRCKMRCDVQGEVGC
jgi:hypothetical protein